MEAPASKDWFLRKHEDGSIFGPIPFEQWSLFGSEIDGDTFIVNSCDGTRKRSARCRFCFKRKDRPTIRNR